MNARPASLALILVLAFPAAEPGWSEKPDRPLNAPGFWEKSGVRPARQMPPILAPQAFDWIMDPAQGAFTGLGPDGNRTLVVDRTPPEELFAILGRVPRLPDKAPETPTFGYVSSRPGDTTVLLARLDDCPTNGCDRLFRVELRADALGLSLADHLHPTPGLGRDAATASGLRLGMTRKEVRAILGEPRREDSHAMFYEADSKRWLTEAEQEDRAFSPGEDIVLVARTIEVAFREERAISIAVQHRLFWVNSDATKNRRRSPA